MEGIYLLELSTGAIKVGRSTVLAERLRDHERNLAMAGAVVLQSWTCTVSDSAKVEDRIIRLFVSMPNVVLVSGREVFRGLGFFEAMALSRDVCSGYTAVADRTLPVRPVPPILGEMLDLMDEARVDRLQFRDIHARLAERDVRYGEMATGVVQQQLWEVGIKARRYRLSPRANPIRGYFRSDILDTIAKLQGNIKCRTA